MTSLTTDSARVRRDWAEFASWTGDGLCREVFFFESGGERLYGSLYAAAEQTCPLGVVACNSWGVEADRCEPMLRSVVLEMARLGGAGLVFHYPGYGDSYGDLAGLDLARLSAAAADAAGEASRRLPDLNWILAGFCFGASVACLAQQLLATNHLLLVQPALRPGAYFNSLAQRTEPLPRRPGPSPKLRMEAGSTTGMAYGYPLPGRIVAAAAEADAAVVAALADFAGEGALVRHLQPEEPLPVPDRFERVDVSGTWRFGSLNNTNLAEATVEWLARRCADGCR